MTLVDHQLAWRWEKWQRHWCIGRTTRIKHPVEEERLHLNWEFHSWASSQLKETISCCIQNTVCLSLKYNIHKCPTMLLTWIPVSVHWFHRNHIPWSLEYSEHGHLGSGQDYVWLHQKVLRAEEGAGKVLGWDLPTFLYIMQIFTYAKGTRSQSIIFRYSMKMLLVWHSFTQACWMVLGGYRKAYWGRKAASLPLCCAISSRITHPLKADHFRGVYYVTAPVIPQVLHVLFCVTQI